MAPETQEQQGNGSTGETQGQEQQGQQQGTTPETGGNGGQQQAEGTTLTVDDSTQLPDTHPLVKAYASTREKLTTANRELAEARTQAGKATQLETDLQARPTQEALDTLQARYDRLEAFTQAVGLGKALDSRTFTKDLFETDKDIATLVKDWNKANPSATSQALSSAAGGQQGTAKHDPNELLRIAAGKA